jgi:hypothetical protein
MNAPSAKSDTDSNHAIATLPLGVLEQALTGAWHLVHQIQGFALQLDLAELGDIELPPEMVTEGDRTHLKTTAALYLASELEFARILPAVETFVGIAISGGLRNDLGSAVPLIAQFWKARHQRFTISERQAIFARLFGTQAGPTLGISGGRNTAFEGLMMNLAESLYKFNSVYAVNAAFGIDTYRSNDISIRVAGRQLASNLISRSGGIATFAAQELVRSLAQALDILKQRPVQQAVQARSFWTALRNISRYYLNEDIDVDSHVQRGRSGMQILSWLAEVLPHLEADSTPIVTPDHPVVIAAGTWLQLSHTSNAVSYTSDAAQPSPSLVGGFP